MYWLKVDLLKRRGQKFHDDYHMWIDKVHWLLYKFMMEVCHTLHYLWSCCLNYSLMIRNDMFIVEDNKSL